MTEQEEIEAMARWTPPENEADPLPDPKGWKQATAEELDALRSRAPQAGADVETDRERDTLLAALRLWKAFITDRQWSTLELHEISEGGRHGPDAALSAAEVDALIARRVSLRSERERAQTAGPGAEGASLRVGEKPIADQVAILRHSLGAAGPEAGADVREMATELADMIRAIYGEDAVVNGKRFSASDPLLPRADAIDLIASALVSYRAQVLEECAKVADKVAADLTSAQFCAADLGGAIDFQQRSWGASEVAAAIRARKEKTL